MPSERGRWAEQGVWDTMLPDYQRYKDRNRIERMFGKLKPQRRSAPRYDKTVLSFASFLNLAAVRLWLTSFLNAAYTLLVLD